MPLEGLLLLSGHEQTAPKSDIPILNGKPSKFDTMTHRELQNGSCPKFSSEKPTFPKKKSEHSSTYKSSLEWEEHHSSIEFHPCHSSKIIKDHFHNC